MVSSDIVAYFQTLLLPHSKFCQVLHIKDLYILRGGTLSSCFKFFTYVNVCICYFFNLCHM